MPRWLYIIQGLLWCILCVSSGHAEDDEKDDTIVYSFVVSAWYENISPSAMELEYLSMLECEEARERIEDELTKQDDEKFGYAMTRCHRLTE